MRAIITYKLLGNLNHEEKNIWLPSVPRHRQTANQTYPTIRTPGLLRPAHLEADIVGEKVGFGVGAGGGVVVGDFDAEAFFFRSHKTGWAGQVGVKG